MASQGCPWWPSRVTPMASSSWWPVRDVHGGLPVASLHCPLCPQQGLTGPIGPPGPAGPNGEKVRLGWPHRCSHRDRSHLISGMDPTPSPGWIPPHSLGRPIQPPPPSFPGRVRPPGPIWSCWCPWCPRKCPCPPAVLPMPHLPHSVDSHPISPTGRAWRARSPRPCWICWTPGEFCPPKNPSQCPHWPLSTEH